MVVAVSVPVELPTLMRFPPLADLAVVSMLSRLSLPAAFCTWNAEVEFVAFWKLAEPVTVSCPVVLTVGELPELSLPVSSNANVVVEPTKPVEVGEVAPVVYTR
jgi:hypothetical protein